MTEKALEINNLTVIYEKSSKPALQDISFAVSKGEFVGVMGAKRIVGSRFCNGKSSVLRDEMGRRIDKAKELVRLIGFKKGK